MKQQDLLRLCDERRFPEWKHRPFRIRIDGERWTCATDGMTILVARGAIGRAGPAPDKTIQAKIVDWLTVRETRPTLKASVGDLRQWCGGNSCDSLTRPGLIVGVTVDRNRLDDAVRGADRGETVSVRRVKMGRAAGNFMLLIAGQDWRTGVMSMVRGMGATVPPTYPEREP